MDTENTDRLNRCRVPGVSWFRPERTARVARDSGTCVAPPRRRGDDPKQSVLKQTTPPLRLLGRQRECEELDGLLGDVLAGRSRTVLLRGEAGVGKTALLSYLSERVADSQVARAAGVESEMELPYSGLHQLCAPMLERLVGLPGPQRNALATVFGRRSGAAPDAFLVGLATLSLFAEVAEQRPLVCIVDDAHWFDQASAQILAFVARRLLAERVALVCAARTGINEEVLAGLPELLVGALDDKDSRTLLLDNMHGPLDVAVREQIIAECHGNPLALLELPRSWNQAELAGGFGHPASGRVAGKIEESYARRLLQLPSDTRLLVLAGAAEPSGDPLLLQRAAGTLGLDMAAIGPAVDAGLLGVGTRVEFAHPLVRSAVYRSAATADRRRVHGALAQATDAGTDPDRRAWHRAEATAGPDEAVATELELSAIRAQARGGVAAGAAFLQRAVALSQDPVRRGERALAAAEARLEVGAFDMALGLIATAEAGPLDEFQRARVDLLHARLAFASSRATEAAPLLLAAARRLDPLDGSLARETYLNAFFAALSGARFNDGVVAAQVARAARGAARRSGDEATAAGLLLAALVGLADDYDTGVPLCRAALQKLSADMISAQERHRWLWQGAGVALEVWDDESAYLLSYRSVRIAREMGTLSELTQALNTHAPVVVLSGELSAAASAVAETQSVQEVTEISSPPYAALILEAWRGNSREVRALAEMTIRGGARGEGVGVAMSEYARAVLCNGLGQYEEALVAACSASQYQEVVFENWGLTELIEPATRTGRTDLATDALNRLARKARAAGTDWAFGIEARSRALLSEDDRADGLFREAIEHLGETRIRAELARTHLLFGEWLRREGRRVDARAQLRSALDQFTSFGMDAFAERARRELQATGEKVRKRTEETRDELTAQERQIAQLARDGLSNPEIGARLFLSPRTVEYHLSKVFTKLGIRSRGQLANALPGSGSEVMPA
jgi:DNA-binding CsgD family transcriptional regulator